MKFLLADYAERLAEELNLRGKSRTANAYRTTATRVAAFAGSPKVDMRKIDARFVEDFQRALVDQGRTRNTVSFYMRTLRAILNKAAGEGIIKPLKDSAFDGVYTGVEAARKESLSAADLELLASLDPTVDGNPHRLPEHLSQALAMFLFCCHARGMGFLEMAHLRKSDIAGGTMFYRRNLSGPVVEQRLLPAMKRIVEWFEPITAGSEYVFPVMGMDSRDEGLQYQSGLRLQNQRLKKIADLCRIPTRLTTHTARHSWAAVAWEAGVPVGVIGAALGHANQRMTESYLDLLENTSLEYASRLVSDALVPRNTRNVRTADVRAGRVLS